MSGIIIAPEKAFSVIRNDKDLAWVLKQRVSPNFTWWEVLMSGGNTEAQVIATDISIFQNALRHSVTMEIIRGIFDAPINMTSGGWYRHPIRNQAAGGATRSQHLYGLASDFQVAGYEGPAGNLKVQKILDPLPFMQKCGLEWTGGSWTHADSRGHKDRFSS